MRPGSNRLWPRSRPDDRVQFERLGYFCVDPDANSERTGLQPHRDAARHLGEDPGRQRRKRAQFTPIPVNS